MATIMYLVQKIIVFGSIFLIFNMICHKLLYGSFIFKDVYEYYQTQKNLEFNNFRNEQAKAYYIPGFTQPNPEICINLGVNFTLLVIIPSPPTHRKQRIRIRKTWGKYRKNFAIGFIMGKTNNMYIQRSLVIESFAFTDMIITNFEDGFKAQTFKAIAMMQWVTEYCPKVKFLLKADDNMYINIPRLLHFLNDTDEEKNAIYGELRQFEEPERKRKKKLYVPKEEYSPGIYPDYILRQSYVLPAYLAPLYYNASLEQQFLRFEDVFMTGLVAQSLYSARIDVPAFSNFQDFGAAGPCSVFWIISSEVQKFTKQLSICDKSWKI